MTEIFVIDIEENISNDLYQDLYNIISDERKDKVKRYKFEIDAKRCVYAGALVQYLACYKLDIYNKDIHIVKNQYGKPYFYDISNQYFNVSHSGKWVVCGWGQHEIGVDVEVVDDMDIDIAKRFFAKSEYKLLMEKNKEEQKQLFFDLWTLKESYIKYMGIGLSIPLNSFEFIIRDGNVDLISKDSEKLFFYRFDLDNKHKLAICTNDTQISGIKQIGLDEIVNRCNILKSK